MKELFQFWDTGTGIPVRRERAARWPTNGGRRLRSSIGSVGSRGS